MYVLAKYHPEVKTVKMCGKNILINVRFCRPEQFHNIEFKQINQEKDATREFERGTAFQEHNAQLSNLKPTTGRAH